MKAALNEKLFQEYADVFSYVDVHYPSWERLLTDGSIKIKTNQHEVNFALIEQIINKFNLRITDVSFTDYYGIVFGIKKL